MVYAFRGHDDKPHQVGRMPREVVHGPPEHLALGFDSASFEPEFPPVGCIAGVAVLTDS